MLRKGYVFLLVVFLCKTLTGISCNSGGNAPAGDSEQIFPMLGIFYFFFSFLSPLFRSSLRCGGGGAEEQRAPSRPLRLPPVSDTPRCRPGQGLPAGLGTTNSAGPLPPDPRRETAPGTMAGGWCSLAASLGTDAPCPLAAGHRAAGAGKGTGSSLRCRKPCGSPAVCWGCSRGG